MSRDPNTSLVSPNPPIAWWQEREFWLLAVLVCGFFFSRLTDIPLRGEESRRGRIAWEMVHAGNWSVPRIQGEPRLTRPPLQYWVIALTGMARGEVDMVAVRFPSALATLITALLIYVYARSFLSPLGAFTSATAYATFGQVLQLGRLGETESIFTLFCCGSLLVWHEGMMRGRSPWWTWCAAWSLAGLATLAKGPQAPVYFVGGIGLFLILTRNLRAIWTRAQFAGFGCFCVIFFAWLFPFLQSLGADGFVETFTGETGKRFVDNSLFTFVKHLIMFPLELLGCLAPWSLLLAPYCSPAFRRSLGEYRLPATFLTACLIVAFPTIWLPPGAQTRYFMPLFPMVALLVGIVIQRAADGQIAADWQIHLNRYFAGLAGVMFLAGIAVPAVAALQSDGMLRQPWWVAGCYAFCTLALAGLLLESRSRFQTGRSLTVVASIALFMGGSYASIALNILDRRSHDPVPSITRLKGQLPEDTQLVSFGTVRHLFAFHLGQPLPQQDWPTAAADVPPKLDYFCVNLDDGKVPELPFAWEEIARISCDRYHQKAPVAGVVVGRQIRNGEPATAPIARNSSADPKR